MVRTLCSRCAMGCGVRAIVGDDRQLVVEGDRIHPVNMGWLCPEGLALPLASDLEGRLLHATVAGRKVGRDRAIAQAARRLGEILERHGPDSIALHVAGDLPTEDYYVANKWMKAFLGSANILLPWRETGARAHMAAFGEDVMPTSVEDIDRADLILVVGAHTLDSHPALDRRVTVAREAGDTRLIVIDPDNAANSPLPDLHLSPLAGTEHRLLGGLLLHAHERGLTDLLAAPAGFWEALAPGHDIWSVARDTGVAIATIRQFYDLFAGAPRTVTLFDPDYADGVDDSRTAAAILTLHIVTARIGKVGAGPFAMPGTPNAMGVREVGCTPYSLAAHRDFSAQARASITRFWSAPRLIDRPGPSREALMTAIDKGAIKALILLGTGIADIPVASRPFTIFAGDSINPDDAPLADIALPMAGVLERDGTLTGSDRLIARQRPIFTLPGEAKPGWWIITQIARAMGWQDAFHYERPADIYREHARLSAYHDDGHRLFSLRRHASMSNPAYDELTPWRWGGLPFVEGRFPTADSQGRLQRFWD